MIRKILEAAFRDIFGGDAILIIGTLAVVFGDCSVNQCGNSVFE